jgi:tryptophan synthase beta chain
VTGTDPAEPDIAPVLDMSGHFPAVGTACGRWFAPEALMAALDELTVAHEHARTDPAFHAELDRLLRSYAGRPTLLTQAERLGARRGAGNNRSVSTATVSSC